MTQFTDEIDKAIAALEERLTTPQIDVTSGADQDVPPDFEERTKLDKSIRELFSIRAAVEPPHSPLPDPELRQRLYDVQWSHGLIDPNTPRPKR